MQKNKWDEDFQDFLAASPTSVPTNTSRKVLSEIHHRLNPPAFSVFLKTSFIHFVVGSFSLLLCPQFGISLTGSMGLMRYMMQYGETVCMFACGALFTSVSLLAISLILKPEEVRVLERNKSLQILALSTLSIGAFLCLGAEVILSIGAIWAAGAVLGGILSLEAGWKLRRYVLSRGSL